MYAKINGGTVVKFPYSFGDLRKDNPNVSFPKNITQSISQRYGMQSVFTLDDPTYDPTTQKIVEATTPTRETNGVYTEEDAPLPEMVGEPIYTGRWVLEKTVADMTADEIATRDAETAVKNRAIRNTLLDNSDWTQMNDSPLANEAKTAWATYRQALRDLSGLAAWPNLTDADWPVAP